MKYHYLTDESENSLAPFFSRQVLSAGLAGTAIVGIILLLFWPRQPLAGIMSTGSQPAVFFLASAAALIVNAYISLRCGAGDMIRNGYHMVYDAAAHSTYETQFGFYGYGLIEFLLHGLVLLLLFLPLLALAAFVSATSWEVFLEAVAVLYSAALLCRMSGFTAYLLWGRSSTLGYFTVRATMIIFVFITVIFAPLINPLYILYLLTYNAESAAHPFAFYMTAVTLIAVMLAWVDNTLVRRNMNRTKV